MLRAGALDGAGFGLAAGPLNGQPGLLFPSRPTVALVALHTSLASGFAVGPSAISACAAAGVWALAPIVIGACALALAALSLSLHSPAPPPLSAAASSTGSTSRASWYFGSIVVLYALCEGTFANWCVVYLREERSVSAPLAAAALSSFWCALALGRLGSSALLARVPADAVWRCLPFGMAAAFLLLPAVGSATSGVVVFGLAGLACSAFFPLTVSLASQYVEGGAARAASQLTAALMIGVGLGSFVLGPLRAGASLAALYGASAAYPALIVVLCFGSIGRARLVRE